MLLMMGNERAAAGTDSCWRLCQAPPRQCHSTEGLSGRAWPSATGDKSLESKIILNTFGFSVRKGCFKDLPKGKETYFQIHTLSLLRDVSLGPLDFNNFQLMSGNIKITSLCQNGDWEFSRKKNI